MNRTRTLVLEEITRVAAVCFGETGYCATTLDTIAAKVGISKATLYTYVSSKEELLWRASVGTPKHIGATGGERAARAAGC